MGFLLVMSGSDFFAFSSSILRLEKPVMNYKGKYLSIIYAYKI